MRRSVITVTLLLPFALAALPLLAIFLTGSDPAYAGGTIAVTPAVAAVATARAVPTDKTLAQTVSQGTQDTCLDGPVGAQS